MKILKYFFFLCCLSIQSQHIITLDNNFDFKQLDYSIFLNYYHDIDNLETKNSIVTKNFLPYTNYFSSEKNTKCWFTFKVANTTEIDKNIFLKIKAYSYFKKLKVYVKNNGQLEEVYEEKNLVAKKIDIPLNLLQNEKKEYFIEVLFTNNIYFPIKLVSEKENKKLEKLNYIKLSLFYGFVLFALLINIFFLVATKDDFFKYYSLLLISIILGISNLDGFFYYLLGNSFIVLNIKLLLNIMVALTFVMFTNNALKLKKYYPKTKNIGYYLILITFILYSIFLISSKPIFYSLGKVIYFLNIIIYFIYGILMIKVSIYARFLVVGYSILIVTHILFLLPISFGFKNFGFTDWHYKIGSVLEIIVFLYAISYRHKQVVKDKEFINQKLVNHLEVERKNSLSEKELFKQFIKEYNFTNREEEVIERVLQGKTNKEISNDLFIELSTVKYHLSKIFLKLDINKRTQIISKISDFKSNRN